LLVYEVNCELINIVIYDINWWDIDVPSVLCTAGWVTGKGIASSPYKASGRNIQSSL